MIWILRVLFLGVMVLTAIFYASDAYTAYTVATWQRAAGGFILALALIILDIVLKRSLLQGFLMCLFGLIAGLLISHLFVFSAKVLIGQDHNVIRLIAVVSSLSFGYLGVIIAYKKRDDFRIITPMFSASYKSRSLIYKILDTSAIIDGRIADICQTGFVEGTLVIPRFVLKELQYIADSSDVIKRNRGRRGLDVLRMMQKSPDIDVEIMDRDFLDIKEVDAKLVALAKNLAAKIITNDFNLNKVAELQGVIVLNINDLMNAIKPVILPGETMQVRVVKEGKEYNQGVAYLDDGTMVIVDNGRECLGQSIEVQVTSILQTAAGRLIFTRRKGEEG